MNRAYAPALLSAATRLRGVLLERAHDDDPAEGLADRGELARQDPGGVRRPLSRFGKLRGG